MNAPATVELDLEYPVEIDGIVHSRLTFRRMKAKDAMAAEGEENKIRAGYLLVAAIADVPVVVIEDLDVVDLERVMATVTPLMGNSLAVKLAESEAASATKN